MQANLERVKGQILISFNTSHTDTNSFITCIFYRYFWKIVNNGNGHAVAFIGINYPGSMTATSLTTYQKSACSQPIAPIFNTTNGYNYITNVAYGGANNYGNIFACRLENLLLPEMVYVRDFGMGNPAGTTWILLTPP